MASMCTDGLRLWIPGLITLIVLILVSEYTEGATADVFMAFYIIYLFFFIILTVVWNNIDRYSTDSWIKGAERFTDGVVQTPFNLPGEHGTVDLPILYHDASVIEMIYIVDSAKVRALIKANGKADYFEPYSICGKTYLLIVVMEYRDTSVGAYNEVAVAVDCKRKGTNPSLLSWLWDLRSTKDHALVLFNLPVTSDAALAAGKHVWGFPKYISDINTTFEKGHFRGKLGEEFEITHTSGCGLTLGGLPWPLLTVKDGHLTNLVVNIGSKAKYYSGSSVKITPGENTKGPTITTIRNLGLLDKKPLLVSRADAFTSILPEGTVLGQASQTPTRKVTQGYGNMSESKSPKVDTRAVIFNASSKFGFFHNDELIVKVVEDSQASVAGVCVGFRILKVNGKDVEADSDIIDDAIAVTRKKMKDTTILFETVKRMANDVAKHIKNVWSDADIRVLDLSDEVSQGLKKSWAKADIKEKEKNVVPLLETKEPTVQV